MQNRNIFYTLCIVFILILSYYFFLSPPRDFPIGRTVKIEKGSSLRSVSKLLKKENLVRSRLAFEAFVILFAGEKVVESSYYFEEKLPVWKVSRRVSKGEHHLAPVAVTIPEGFNNKEIAEIFAAKLTDFNKEEFLAKTVNLEGYLFPDTYFFVGTDTEEAVILSMTDNFNNKIKSMQPDIFKSGRAEKDIITMASIIEGEAKGPDDRATISGILWKRIKIGMPLQADAAPITYKSKGLPKNPINNPGKAAIFAAIYPENTEYLYYLHDDRGLIHFAKTYSQHLKNISKYLN